ncbi:hypothetical protein EAI88_13335 [Eubacterium ramulus]|nr:hypothetical protein EAI88_13335 [Eubacterium ramulus]
MAGRQLGRVAAYFIMILMDLVLFLLKKVVIPNNRSLGYKLMIPDTLETMEYNLGFVDNIER